MSSLLRAAMAMRCACRPDVTNPESVMMLRAALLALREPDEAMWLAGADTLTGGGINWRKSKFRRAWQAAIDSILAAGEGER